MIGIFASSTDDIKRLIEKAQIIKRKTFGKAIVMEAILANKKVLLVATGYNKINLGMAAGYVGANYTLDMIIGLGNCGYLERSDIKIGDIAIGASSVQYSVNSTAIGFPNTVIPNVGLGVFYSTPHLVTLAQSACKELGYKNFTGRIATGEKFIADEKERNFIANKYNCQFIDMECGGAGEVAYLLNIPVIFVKGISNFANKNASADFKKYADICNDRSCEVAMVLLKNMQGEVHCDCKQSEGCKVNLKRFRELNKQEIRNTIEQSSYLNLGVSDNNIPYVVPMCFEVDNRYPDRFLLLSKPYGQKITCMKNNDNVVLEFMNKSENGVKTVVAYGRAIMNYYSNGEGLMKIIVEVHSMTGREYFDYK